MKFKSSEEIVFALFSLLPSHTDITFNVLINGDLSEGESLKENGEGAGVREKLVKDGKGVFYNLVFVSIEQVFKKL